jgi:hypothetical protein
VCCPEPLLLQRFFCAIVSALIVGKIFFTFTQPFFTGKQFILQTDSFIVKTILGKFTSNNHSGLQKAGSAKPAAVVQILLSGYDKDLFPVCR